MEIDRFDLSEYVLMKRVKTDGPTVRDVYESMNEDQKAVLHYIVAEALDAAFELRPTPGRRRRRT